MWPLLLATAAHAQTSPYTTIVYEETDQVQALGFYVEVNTLVFTTVASANLEFRSGAFAFSAGAGAGNFLDVTIGSARAQVHYFVGEGKGPFELALGVGFSAGNGFNYVLPQAYLGYRRQNPGRSTIARIGLAFGHGSGGLSMSLGFQ